MSELSTTALTLAVQSLEIGASFEDVQKRAWQYLVFMNEAQLDYDQMIEQKVRQGVPHRDARVASNPCELAESLVRDRLVKAQDDAIRSQVSHSPLKTLWESAGGKA